MRENQDETATAAHHNIVGMYPLFYEVSCDAIDFLADIDPAVTGLDLDHFKIEELEFIHFCRRAASQSFLQTLLKSRRHAYSISTTCPFKGERGEYCR